MPVKTKTTVTEGTTLTLGTLAAGDVIGQAGPVMTAPGTMISSTISPKWQGRTADDGPLMWGLADVDLSDAEVEEFLEIQGPISPADIVGMERAGRSRRVKVLGVLGMAPTEKATAGDIADFLRNERIRLGFVTGWRWFVRNQGSVLTTGGSIVFTSLAFVEFSEQS